MKLIADSVAVPPLYFMLSLRVAKVPQFRLFKSAQLLVHRCIGP